MSAWMVSDAHVDFLTTAFVMRVEPTDPRPIGQRLITENANSIAARYAHDEAYVNEAREQEKGYSFREWPRMQDVDPAMIAYAIMCYDYQSCEHDEWETSEAKAMMDALRKTVSEIDQERAKAAPFGTWPWGLEEEHRAQDWRRPDMKAKAEPEQVPDEQRQACRDTLRKICDAPDAEFDELARCLSLGIEIEEMFNAIDGVQDMASRLGARAAKALKGITYKGHEYHVAAERCPNCEQRNKEQAEPEATAEAPPAPKAE